MTSSSLVTHIEQFEWMCDLYQKRIGEWVHHVFGKAWLTSLEERQYRFLEEACELVQATGLTKEQAQKILDYVYDGEPGEYRQEMGGVFITFLAFAEHYNESAALALRNEFHRIHEQQVVEKCRRKAHVKIIKGITGTNLKIGDN